MSNVNVRLEDADFSAWDLFLNTNNDRSNDAAGKIVIDQPEMHSGLANMQNRAAESRWPGILDSLTKRTDGSTACLTAAAGKELATFAKEHKVVITVPAAKKPDQKLFDELKGAVAQALGSATRIESTPIIGHPTPQWDLGFGLMPNMGVTAHLMNNQWYLAAYGSDIIGPTVELYSVKSPELDALAKKISQSAG